MELGLSIDAKTQRQSKRLTRLLKHTGQTTNVLFFKLRSFILKEMRGYSLKHVKLGINITKMFGYLVGPGKKNIKCNLQQG